MKNFIKILFNKFNIQITKRTSYINLIERLNACEYNFDVANKKNIEYYEGFEYFEELLLQNLNHFVEVLPKSKSQLRQDLFVLNHLNFKKNGY